jgi:hypothetical protein
MHTPEARSSPEAIRNKSRNVRIHSDQLIVELKCLLHELEQLSRQTKDRLEELLSHCPPLSPSVQ